MTREEAEEYIWQAEEAEGEQRAEYGMGAASLGYDPAEWMGAYEGYRISDDPQYAEAKRIVAEYYAGDTTSDQRPCPGGCGVMVEPYAPCGSEQCRVQTDDDIPF